MLSVRNWIAARRYWKYITKHQHHYAVPADVKILRGAARAEYPALDSRLVDLQRDGVTAITGYWSAEKCAAARAELDRLMQSRPDCVRRFSNDSDKRLFGAERAGPVIADFHDDAFLRSIGEIAGGLQLYNLVTLGARIDATETNRGSGDGWHRDTFGFQF